MYIIIYNAVTDFDIAYTLDDAQARVRELIEEEYAIDDIRVYQGKELEMDVNFGQVEVTIKGWGK